MTEKVSRRKFATLVGGIGLTALAGCSGDGEDTAPEDTTTTTTTTDQTTSDESTTTSEMVTITSREQYDEIAENFDEWKGTEVRIQSADYYTEGDESGWFVFKDFQDPDEEYPYYYFISGPSREAVEGTGTVSVEGVLHDVTTESGHKMLWVSEAELGAPMEDASSGETTTEEDATIGKDSTIETPAQYDQLVANFDEWEGKTINIEDVVYYGEHDGEGDWHYFHEFKEYDSQEDYRIYVVDGVTESDANEHGGTIALTGTVYDVSTIRDLEVVWVSNPEVQAP